MIAFITGATGFIGSLLAERLVQEGWQVHCMVRKTSSLKWLQHLSVNFVQGDLFSTETLAEALSQATHVFHLAGVTKAFNSATYFRANGVGTRSLLQACSRHGNHLERVVYVSSVAAAGPSLDGHPLREEEEPRPVSVYGRSKLAGEAACAEFNSQLPITIIRPPIVYGPRDRDVFQYFKQIKHGIGIRLGRKPRVNSLIHVHDLVEGILTAATSNNAAGETYFITNPEPCEWTQIGKLIAQAMGRRAVFITVPESILPVFVAASELGSRLVRKPSIVNLDKVRESRYRHWVVSAEKAREQLGFVTSLSLEAGLRQTVSWYRENGWL